MFHYFTIKFHFSFFASFRLFSLQIFRFTSLEAKFKSVFSLFIAFFTFFRYFSHFFTFFHIFFAFFRCKFFASLQFSNFYFKAKQSEAKFKFTFFHIFSVFLPFFAFFAFFHFFLLNFCFASIFSLNFRLFYLRFHFRFLVFRIEVNHVKSGFFSLPSETKFWLQFQISLPKRK